MGRLSASWARLLQTVLRTVRKIKVALKSFSREDIAAGLQKHFEDVVTQYIQYYVEETGVGNLALAAVFLPT